MKKALAILSALAMLLALSACGAAANTPVTPAPVSVTDPPATEAPAATEAPSAREITLDVVISRYGPDTGAWFLGGGENSAGFAEKFERENPGVKLNLEVVSPDEARAAVDARVAAGEAPDLAMLGAFADYAADGLLLPVKEYCPDDLFSDFFPAFIDASVLGDTVWALPRTATVRALFCNQELLDEADAAVPADWAGIEEAARRILDRYEGEVYPWGVDMTTGEGQAAFAYYAWGNGGGFTDAAGGWNLNSDENVEALTFAVDLVNNGYTNPAPTTQTRQDLMDLFAAGRLAMVIAPGSLPAYVAEQGGDFNIAAAPLPSNDGKTAASPVELDYLMAFRDDGAPDQTARSEALGKFLRFFYDPDHYAGWVATERCLPTVNSAVAALTAADPSFGMWADILRNCRFYPTEKAGWDQARQGIIAAEQNALFGSDVRAELDALQAQLP